MIGHSLGEYAAACIAGVTSLENTIRLVVERGRLTDELPVAGSMAVVFSKAEKIESIIKPYRP